MSTDDRPGRRQPGVHRQAPPVVLGVVFAIIFLANGNLGMAVAAFLIVEVLHVAE